MYSNLEIINDLKNRLTIERFEHVMRVAQYAKELAITNNLDADKAYLAGLLHDCTKNESLEWQNECLIKHHEFDKLNHANKIKHGYTSKYYAMEIYGIKDEDVLSACYNHVNCESDKILDKLIYIADKREPGRNINDDITKLAPVDIEKAYKLLKEENLKYLKEHKII